MEFLKREKLYGKDGFNRQLNWETQTSYGHNIIMLFTDGIEFWPIDVINEFNYKYPNSIVRLKN